NPKSQIPNPQSLISNLSLIPLLPFAPCSLSLSCYNPVMLTAMPFWSAWLLAARPRTLPASIAPVLVGSALAASAGRFDWLLAAATLAVSLLLQIGANFANDV